MKASAVNIPLIIIISGHACFIFMIRNRDQNCVTSRFGKPTDDKSCKKNERLNKERFHQVGDKTVSIKL